jgi:single-strand DNA-binding protein
MANLNKVLLMGNLTRDPELRYTQGGMAVTDLPLAINRRFTRKDGSQVDETVFVDVTVWGRRAEVACEFLSKGRPVFVEGRLKLDTWEREGKKQSKLSVVAENFQFIGPRGGAGGGERAGSKEASDEGQGELGVGDEDIPF